MKKAILIPGNGCDGGPNGLNDCMWYPWFAMQLQDKFNISINLHGFPDPLYAHEEIWKDFAVSKLGLDENTIIIGHSSGAACALRLMEEHVSAGCILVSAYNSDLGDDLEKGSGYFSRGFQYRQMRENTPWIVQFHSANDPLVPVQVGREVARHLADAAEEGEGKVGSVDYLELPLEGHFQDDEYPQFVEVLSRKLMAMDSKGEQSKKE